jgi:hypothetical protein
MGHRHSGAAKQLNRRIPLLKFSSATDLVPVMGLAWWALDFPFMRRHSEGYLKLHPEMRGKDQETTRKACEKFALSVMDLFWKAPASRLPNARQQSPHQHLLKPKTGGAWRWHPRHGRQVSASLDVTIVHLIGTPTFWHFLQAAASCGSWQAWLLPILATWWS